MPYEDPDARPSAGPLIEITPTPVEYEQLCRDLRKLRELGAASNTAAVVSAVHVAAAPPFRQKAAAVTDGGVVTTGELRLAPESIEAVAQRIAELVAADEPDSRRERITAEEVSRWWGVSRRWVYDHADELGARRMGSGRRPRLRFDPDEVAEHLGLLDRKGRGAPVVRGSRGIAGDCKSGSLSSPSRATVGHRHKQRPGRAL